jgi:uncharacterized protein YkwD
MRLRQLLLAASASVVGGCAVQVAPPPAATTAAATTAARGAFGPTESRILDLINSERRRQGLSALVYNPQLDRMAKIQARNMARFQKMAHVIPNADLPTLVDRSRYVGYSYGRLAENVALGYPSAETVVEGWMNSKGHRANILNREVLETGIGIARSTAGGLYYCQVFGRQLSSF